MGGWKAEPEHKWIENHDMNNLFLKMIFTSSEYYSQLLFEAENPRFDFSNSNLLFIFISFIFILRVIGRLWGKNFLISCYRFGDFQIMFLLTSANHANPQLYLFISLPSIEYHKIFTYLISGIGYILILLP